MGLAAVLGAGALFGVWYHHRYVMNRLPTVTYIRMTPVSQEGTRVLVVGGSVAHGWNDSDGGFIVRAFEAFGGDEPFEIVNHSAVGDGPVQYAPKFADDLRRVAPDVLVIAWGTLDDIYNHTPLSAFSAAIRAEIKQALAHRAVVMLVTPPVTKASYTQYRDEEPLYVAAEVAVAHRFDSPNVYVFDVFHEMQAWLTAHRVSYEAYASDGWHPNALGHALAGELLAHDMAKAFGEGPIQFRSPQGKSLDEHGTVAQGKETT
ncbi:hypothetical protein GCM10010885_03130 [Alicyclobacillus cellulosilyticus]|uniref:SGNH hydrolase-type esterase domain-containing protein n=2 Tax=Alicyclobacillus cellulosilyticus TaxID=1003997 RepID=A0A917NF21_9BACL|nr:hypothetical protein GCM10010885_03130 [Alicyclobacillus cellulosilyticus]